MHVFAAVGACVLTAALSVPTILWAGSTSSANSDDDDDKNKVVIEASLAARKSPKKQPQKEFKPPPPPDKPTGVSRDENKDTKAQCCVGEADCNKVSLPFPTTCPDDGRCESNRCKPKRKDKPDDKDKPVTNPDQQPVTSPDSPTGNPTDSTVGQFDGSKKGRAAVNSGDPWLRELANDFVTHVDFPALEEASAALACLRIEKDGTITDSTLNPPTGKRSDNEGLNAKIENAFKKLTEDRKQKPQPVPTHLLEQVVTKWTCIPIDAQTKQN
jgi:hypothetical protein